MSCAYLEKRLESLLAARLPAAEEALCARHLESCGACRELLELAHLGSAASESGTETGPDLVPAVLARTSGGACGRAEELLSEALDEGLECADQELLLEHLTACRDCRALNRVLLELVHELPRLAVLRPDGDFVDDVLRRTLPAEARLRRWWARRWPQLVRRPRFAAEAAYIGLVALLVVFASPGSPLGALPSRALALAHDPAVRAIELPAVDLGARLEATSRALRSSKGARIAADWQAAGKKAVLGGAALMSGFWNRLGTFWEEAASLLERADEESAPESATNEETS